MKHIRIEHHDVKIKKKNTNKNMPRLFPPYWLVKKKLIVFVNRVIPYSGIKECNGLSKTKNNRMLSNYFIFSYELEE